MHSTNLRFSDGTYNDQCVGTSGGTAWNSPQQGTQTAHSRSAEACDSFSKRSPRKQCFYQLLVEFERCAQQAEDFLLVRKDIEKMKRSFDDIHAKIEDINFESKMASDKVKILLQDMQEAKSNHLQLRDETSKEFRKVYKRLGAIDKEVDLIKYRQKMALKKHQLDLEALKWEMRSPGTPESFVCPTGTTNAFKRKPDESDVKQCNDNSFLYQ